MWATNWEEETHIVHTRTAVASNVAQRARHTTRLNPETFILTILSLIVLFQLHNWQRSEPRVCDDAMPFFCKQTSKNEISLCGARSLVFCFTGKNKRHDAVYDNESRERKRGVVFVQTW